ncbi:hypothetical protein HPB47_019428 [Ixodes persulcatus]|uniref:Uncharacterized protein n=1 Tax=Ixodes persulcatus TaxID=34615 RepID=A0AC60QKF8_IXOPE|nr:hypothetical protein HPB47_019428 [Ixodes persulcatus]
MKQDHLVRTIFYKFRKNGGSAGGGSHRSPASPLAALPLPDVEKGGLAAAPAAATASYEPVQTAKVIPILGAPPSHAPRLPRWATLRSDSTAGGDNKESQQADNVPPKPTVPSILPVKDPVAMAVPPRQPAPAATPNGAVSLRGFSKRPKSMGSKSMGPLN